MKNYPSRLRQLGKKKKKNQQDKLPWWVKKKKKKDAGAYMKGLALDFVTRALLRIKGQLWWRRRVECRAEDTKNSDKIKEGRPEQK